MEKNAKNTGIWVERGAHFPPNLTIFFRKLKFYCALTTGPGWPEAEAASGRTRRRPPEAASEAASKTLNLIFICKFFVKNRFFQEQNGFHSKLNIIWAWVVIGSRLEPDFQNWKIIEISKKKFEIFFEKIFFLKNFVLKIFLKIFFNLTHRDSNFDFFVENFGFFEFS